MTTTSPPPRPPTTRSRSRFVYSPEKEKLLEPLIEEFNKKGEKVGGKPVFIEAEVVSSGEAERKIATNEAQADRLVARLVPLGPPAQLPGRRAPTRPTSRRRSSAPRSSSRCGSRSRARSATRRRPRSRFDQILKLATDPQGWGAVGKPQFGKFKLGHTNPDFSTSGLSAVAGEYYATTGKREGLTVEDIEDPQVRKQVKDIEQSIVHYGDTTLFFADQLKRYGQGYASAVAMEEVTVLDFNRDRGGQTKLVALYPKEGTFYSDNPFIVLDAPWVNAQQKDAASVFQKFLAREITPAKAGEEGFRAGDPDAKPAGRVTKQNGADPAEPKRTLSLPQPRVLDRIKSAWREDRKPANVMVVVDVSGSMGEEGKLDQAKQGLKAFFKEIGKQDNIGFVAFNDQVVVDKPIRRFGETRAELEQTVDELFPDGETAVYGATDLGWTRIRDLADEEGINAVVVLTDGEDTSSRVPPEELQKAFRDQSKPESKLPIRVYTIAYGSQANKEVLKQIAESSGGKAFEGDPDDIESVYRSISSFF